jgi:prophage regulatory protein
MLDHVNTPDTLIRLPQVLQRTGLSRATLYRLAKTGDFPRPVKIGLRASAWRSREINEWVATRVPTPSS